MAKHTRSNQHGAGCLVQIAGVAAMLVGIGLFVPQLAWIIYIAGGACLLIVGWQLDSSHVCSDCGNRVELTSKMCPTCRSTFGKSSPPPIVE